MIISKSCIISTIESVDLVFAELISPMIRDQIDGTLYGTSEHKYEWRDVVGEQESIAKLIHCVGGDDGFELVKCVRRHLGDGGGVRIRFSIPPLVFSGLRIAKVLGVDRVEDVSKRRKAIEDKNGAKNAETGDDAEKEDDVEIDEVLLRAQSPITHTLDELYKFLHVTIATLLKAQESFQELEEGGGNSLLFGPSEGGACQSGDGFGTGLLSPPDIALRLFLECGKSADEMLSEDLAYDFIVQVCYFSLTCRLSLFTKSQSERVERKHAH
jgi:vacuolar protein sorting-associated protein 35